MREKIRIKEKLHIIVRDKYTKEVIRDETIYPKLSKWRRFLDKIVGKDSHATILAFGFEQMVRLLGNVGTQRQIDRIITTYATVATSNSVDVGGASGSTLYVNNSANPFDTAGVYTWIKTANSGAVTSYINSITVNINISSDQEWWSEIEFRFSQ